MPRFWNIPNLYTDYRGYHVSESIGVGSSVAVSSSGNLSSYEDTVAVVTDALQRGDIAADNDSVVLLLTDKDTSQVRWDEMLMEWQFWGRLVLDSARDRPVHLGLQNTLSILIHCF